MHHSFTALPVYTNNRSYKQYLQKYLSIDELNPEANRSMALIYLFGNDAEKALQYFEKEMQVAQRRSLLAQLVKSGHRNRINLASFRKQKMQFDSTDNRNFFEEIALGKFKIPDPPENSKASAAWKAGHAGLRQSIAEETMFWMNASQATPEQLRAEGKSHASVYHGLVNELISDLGDKYIPLLGIINEDDVPYLTQLQYDYQKG